MIFFSNPGRVSTLDTPALPIMVSMTCWDSKKFKAIITQVGIANQGGYQFMHSLRDYIYIYVFSERIGELNVSGVAFMGDCHGSGPGESGVERVLQYYYKMRATRRLAPVTVQVGATTFNGFLLAARADIVDADTGLGRFSFKFHFPPDDIASGGEIICDSASDTAELFSDSFCGGDFDCGGEVHDLTTSSIDDLISPTTGPIVPSSGLTGVNTDGNNLIGVGTQRTL